MNKLLQKLLRKDSLLQSGFILSAVGLLTQAFNYLFQAVVSRELDHTDGEFGLVNACIAFIGLLGMPSAIITQAVTHYIARYHSGGDDARLEGLLAGCRKLILDSTIVCTGLVLILIKPLGDYFHIPRTALMIISLVCVIAGLWSSYVTVLCQGLGWFRRLALISLLGAIGRVLFAVPAARIWPVAEGAVLASFIALVPCLLLLRWRKEFPHTAHPPISPWNWDLVKYLFITGAYILGCYCFAQSDILLAKKYFTEKADLDAFAAAGLLPRALPMAAGPLLIVLFTYRSGRRQDDGLREQMRLFVIYAVGLITGAIVLYFLRHVCLAVLGHNIPHAADMLGPITLTMVFTGLIQSLASWALASRWTHVTLLYGALGIAYWEVLRHRGQTPAGMLHYMPITLGAAFFIVLAVWLFTMWRTHGGVKEDKAA